MLENETKMKHYFEKDEKLKNDTRRAGDYGRSNIDCNSESHVPSGNVRCANDKKKLYILKRIKKRRRERKFNCTKNVSFDR